MASHYQRSLLLLYSTALVCLGLILLFIHQQYQNESQQIAQQYNIALDVAYRSTLDMYRLDVETRLETQVMQSDILSLLEKASSADSETLPILRGQLYRQFHREYQRMRRNGLSHFYFYLPDGTTLLRFHSPTIAGDNAEKTNPVLQLAHQHKKPQSGFSTSQMLTPAFRYVHPIIQNGHHYGTVEFSVPFDVIHKNIVWLLPDGDYTLLISAKHQDVATEMVPRDKFIPSPLSEHWLLENPNISRISRNFIHSELSRSILPILAKDRALQARLQNGGAFSIPLLHQGVGYIVTMYGIQSPRDETVAWIIGLSEAPSLKRLRQNLVSYGLLSAILIILLAITVHTVLRQRHQLHALSHLDGLTGIANRRAFDATLEKEWQRGGRAREPLAILLMDIDFFKQYNDHYGHPAGDKCLRQVAQTITDQLTRSSDMVARYGGEEFICLLPDTDNEGAMHMAEKIRQAITDERIPHEKSTIASHLTISIGVASAIPNPTQPPSRLVRQADRQLYAAKEVGRNCVST